MHLTSDVSDSHIHLAELQSKAFFSRLWFWVPCIFCYQILFETEEEDEQEATTSLALAKEMNVGFAVEAVLAVVDGIFTPLPPHPSL